MFEKNIDHMSVGPREGVTRKIHVDELISILSDKAIDRLLDRIEERSVDRVSLAKRKKDQIELRIEELQKELAKLQFEKGEL